MTDSPSFVPVDSVYQGLLHRLWQHPSARSGLVLVSLFLFVAFLGPFLLRNNASGDFNYQNLRDNLLPPTSENHFLGTDHLGRDEAVRLVFGARYTILIALSAVGLEIIIGVSLGALSGFFGGWTDLIIQRFIDILLAFPPFLLALALVTFSGAGLRNLVIALAVASFPRYVRLVRASILSVREVQFVEAAYALGVSKSRILWRHVLPNSLTPAIAQTPLEMASAILTAAGLGFLGLGVQPPTPEWGAMLGQSRDYLFSAAYLVTSPGLCILGVILAFNLLGDGVRDIFDPRLRSRTKKRMNGEAMIHGE